MSWLKEVVQAKSSSEAPARYFWWSALAVLAATVRKNVYLDRFHYILYPNIYVILVSARSGLRKGIPISMASSMLNEIEATRVLSGQMSIQGVIHELSQQRTAENGRVFSEAQAILLSDEFAAYLVDDPKALTTLTALHNTHEHEAGWKKILKSSPIEMLKNPCITMLAASNERLFEEVVKGRDIEGGFIARTFIVYESKRQRIDSLMWKPKGLKSNKELSCYLKELTEVKGQFTIEDKVRHTYDLWYIDLCNLKTQDRTGALDRLGDQVLKAAMLISLAREPSLEINEVDMDEAISECETCIGGTNQVSIGAGQSETAPAVAKVLKALISAPNNEITRQKLLRTLWPDIDSITLDKVIDTINETGALESFRGPGKIGVVYRLKEDIAEQYRNFRKEIN